jgi:hypothetical protein
MRLLIPTGVISNSARMAPTKATAQPSRNPAKMRMVAMTNLLL